MNRNWAIAAAMATLLVCPACGGEDHHHDDPVAEACEHMQDGPAMSVTAIADMAGDAPDVGEHHIRWDIALVDRGGGAADLGGYVDLVVDEASESLLFLGADVAIALWDATGTEVAAEASNADITACAEVAVSHTFDLEVGTYLLEIGPTSETEVQLVVEQAGEHADE